MTLQKYKSFRFNDETEKLLTLAADIIKDYRAQSLRLSLRQLYYVFVTKNVLPNTEKSYKKLGDIVSRGRLAGRLAWDAIEDRNRTPRLPQEFDDLQQLVEAALWSYRLPRLAGQDVYPEVWIEKAALEGVLAPLASSFHVTLMANRGYSSASAMWEAARRIDRRCRDEDGNVISTAKILYLGDLDPSGEDMVRDVRERLEMFLGGYDSGYGAQYSPSGASAVDGVVDITVEKLALTMDQVQQYNPPPNPAKMKDSRADKFVAEFGSSSWEVDALRPDVLQQLIRTRLEAVLDMDAVEQIKAREEADKKQLREAVGRITSGEEKEEEEEEEEES